MLQRPFLQMRLRVCNFRALVNGHGRIGAPTKLLFGCSENPAEALVCSLRGAGMLSFTSVRRKAPEGHRHSGSRQRLDRSKFGAETFATFLSWQARCPRKPAKLDHALHQVHGHPFRVGV